MVLGYLSWLKQALDECLYIEDVKALNHFVFHQRLNGCSNVCLVCDFPVGGIDDHFYDPADDHDENCEYRKAFLRLKDKPTLEEWIEKA